MDPPGSGGVGRADDADAGDPPEARFAATLEAYRRAKLATLHDHGAEPLRRELPAVVRFLESGRGEGEHMGVDVAFREAKARVLEELVREEMG